MRLATAINKIRDHFRSSPCRVVTASMHGRHHLKKEDFFRKPSRVARSPGKTNPRAEWNWARIESSPALVPTPITITIHRWLYCTQKFNWWRRWINNTLKDYFNLVFRICSEVITSPDFLLRSHRIRVYLLLYESKPTNKQEQYDRMPDPSKFFSPLESYCSRLSVGLLSYDSRLTLIRLDRRKKWSRSSVIYYLTHFPIFKINK